jgi:hypothetical protein
MNVPADPIAYLRRLLSAGSHNDVVQMIRDRDSVIARFGPVFSQPDRLSVSDLSDFLLFEHNRHWWGLQRRTDALLASIDSVRQMIAELLDVERPLAVRIDALGEPAEFDHTVWSPILLVTRPVDYGVWNQISEAAMRRLGLWPSGADDLGTGDTYTALNDVLHLVAAELDTDLWTLDALWWGAEKEHDPTRHFVTRSKPAPVRIPRPSRPARTTTRRSSKARTEALTETFVCQSCWMTKPTRLASEIAGRCVDCA